MEFQLKQTWLLKRPEFRFDPPDQVGDATPLVYEGERLGYVLLSKKRCRPIVVAPGTRVFVDSALDLARRYLRDHKLPEPCFAAHQHVNEVKRRILSGEISLSSEKLLSSEKALSPE